MTAAATIPPTDSLAERKKEYLTFYKFCEPVETLFYKALRARFPEMSVMDICVCRAIYIHEKCGGLEIYDRRGVWGLYNLPREEWARYLLENAMLHIAEPERYPLALDQAEDIVKDAIFYHGLETMRNEILIFPTEESFYNAVQKAAHRGYINETPERLREDIEKCLDETLAQAVKTQEYVTDEELFNHEQEQAELDRRHAGGLS